MAVRGFVTAHVTLPERVARRWVREASPSATLYAEQPLKMYVSTRASQTVDVERLRQSLKQVLHYATTYLSQLTTVPDAVYLLDPPSKKKRVLCAQGFPWGVLADVSSVVYSPDPTRFHLAVRRALSYAMLPDTLHDSPFAAGLAEWLARAGDGTLDNEVIALVDNGLVLPQTFSWNHALVAGSFLQFLTERFGQDIWIQMNRLLSTRTRGIRSIALLEPEAGWMLQEICRTRTWDLLTEWWVDLQRRGEGMDRQTRRKHASRCFIREAYSVRLLSACREECGRFLAEYGADSEITFYLAACHAHLGDYPEAIRTLLSAVDDMTSTYRAWAYLRLGQLHDLIGARESALQWYERIREVTDPWGIILSRAELFVQQAYVPFDERVQDDPWLHFRHWLSRGGEGGRPYFSISERRSGSFIVVNYSIS